MPLPVLPIELWLVIIRWATISDTTRFLFAIAYYPFAAGFTDTVDTDSIAVKQAVSSVCKLWRDTSLSLSLEDAMIHHNIDRLKYTLEKHSDLGYKSIHRVCLPYTSCLSYKSAVNAASTLLASLSRLEVLVRPPCSPAENLNFDFPAEDCPMLPSLKRLDWWHYNDASKTGGVNSLTDVLRAAPNLEYLSLWGDNWMGLLHQPPISLPSLTTLRLRSTNAPLLLPLHKWKLPSFTRIIVDNYNGTLPGSLWSTFGNQLETVELGQSVKFGLVDMVQYVLDACPNLKELNYYVQFAAIPCLPKGHRALATVRLHGAQNDFYAGDRNELWEHIEGHFAAFSSARFPALKHIILHGDWTPLTNDYRFKDIEEQVSAADQYLAFNE
ncbi:hypothetical protein EIP86_008040 [Pleurotus ostreatoroseus]|nr:hypothetical protein EIP86_008040 [Pleurotus ostreatoroseus]